jgi:predicted N-formylglutamate amidohydrolase
MTGSGAPLAPGEPLPFFTYRPQEQSSLVMAVDHASSRIPRRLGDLGVPASELQRHFRGNRREMLAAVIYGRDRRFAGLVLDLLRHEPGLVIAENQPYVVDETHYTIPLPAEARGLPQHRYAWRIRCATNVVHCPGFIAP